MAFKFLALSVLVATLAIGTHGQGLLGNIPSLLNEVLSPVSELLTPVTGILEPVLGPDGVLSGILDNNVLGLVKSLQIVGVLQKIVAIVVGLLQTVLSLLDINNIPPEVSFLLLSQCNRLVLGPCCLPEDSDSPQGDCASGGRAHSKAPSG